MTDLNEPLTVDIDLKESDLQRANFWFGLTGWSNRLTLILITLGGLLLLFRIAPSWVFPNSIALILSIIMLGFLPFYFGFIWFQTKRSFQNLQDFQKKIQYTFTPHGYSVRDGKSSADVSWDSILRAAESEYSFHLFFGRSVFHTVPKRCFKSSDDVVRLRTLLKTSLGAKATIR